MRRKNVCLYTLLTIFGLFFFFLVGERGALMGGDSELYIHFGHYSGVMPVYPLFLQGCRLIFGETLYLEAAASIQGLLALLCCLLLTRFLQKNFQTGVFGTVLLFLFSLMPYAIEIPGHVISHELMTEGLAYPLFYVFCILLLKGIFLKKQRWILAGFGLACFLSLVRPQLQFLFAVLTVVFLYVGLWNIWPAAVRRSRLRKAADSGLCILAGVFLLAAGIKTVSVLDGWYEDFFFGGHAQDSSNYTVQCRVLYVSEREDALLFKDEAMRQIYEKTYEEMDSLKTTYHYMRNDLWRWKDIVGCSAYNSRIVQQNVEEYVRKELGVTSEIEVEQTKNQICGEMTRVLLAHNWPNYLRTSLMLMPSGFVASVLFQREGFYTACHIAALILYLAAFAGIYLIYRNRGTDMRKAEFMLLVSGSAVVNVVTSNLILFGLQRYMVYTYGMFYMAMYLMLTELWKKMRKYRL